MLASTEPPSALPVACFHHSTAAKHRFRHLHSVSGAHIQRPGSWDPFRDKLLQVANWKDPPIFNRKTIGKPWENDDLYGKIHPFF